MQMANLKKPMAPKFILIINVLRCPRWHVIWLPGLPRLFGYELSYYFDRNSGKLLMRYGIIPLKCERLKSMNNDLHARAFSGLPTKVLALFCITLCASYP